MKTQSDPLYCVRAASATSHRFGFYVLNYEYSVSVETGGQHHAATDLARASAGVRRDFVNALGQSPSMEFFGLLHPGGLRIRVARSMQIATLFQS